MFTASSLFCEDIREEKTGTDILVGVLPDNVQVERFPAMLPKLGIYTRIVIRTDAEPEKIELFMNSNGQASALGVLDKDFVAREIASSASQGSSICTFVSRALSSPFMVNEETRFTISIKMASLEVKTATLRVHSGQ